MEDMDYMKTRNYVEAILEGMREYAYANNCELN